MILPRALPLLIVGAAILLAGCETAPKKSKQAVVPLLDRARLMSIYGKGDKLVHRWKTPRGAGIARYNADGSAFVDWGSGSSKGKWRVAGNTACTRWFKVRKGKERCSRIFKIGNGKYKGVYTDNAKDGFVFTVGN